MPFGLLKYGLSAKYPARRHFPKAKDLKPAYDVVIVGAGGHGLAAAYYLAKDWGITNIAVLDKGYLAGGNTARNTAIIRSNYLTPDGVRFYDESVRLYQGLSEEFDYNIMYSVRGHFTLAHTDAAMRTSRWRAEVNKHMGVDSELIYPDEIQRLCPSLNLSDDVRYPLLGALYHPPGAIARLDDMGIAPFLISSSVILSCAQRLMRRICSHCKEPVTYPAKMYQDLNMDPGIFEGVTLYRGRGCDRCKNSGYAGRMAIIEAMTVTDEVRRLIITRSSAREMGKVAIGQGMRTLRMVALDRAREGVSTLEQVLLLTAH